MRKGMRQRYRVVIGGVSAYDEEHKPWAPGRILPATRLTLHEAADVIRCQLRRGSRNKAIWRYCGMQPARKLIHHRRPAPNECSVSALSPPQLSTDWRERTIYITRVNVPDDADLTLLPSQRSRIELTGARIKCGS